MPASVASSDCGSDRSHSSPDACWQLPVEADGETLYALCKTNREHAGMIAAGTASVCGHCGDPPEPSWVIIGLCDLCSNKGGH